MNATYKLVIPDGEETDAYFANLERSFRNAMSNKGEMVVDVMATTKDAPKGRIIVKKTSGTSPLEDGAFAVHGHGFVHSESEEPYRHVGYDRPFKCSFIGRTNSVEMNWLHDRV